MKRISIGTRMLWWARHIALVMIATSLAAVDAHAQNVKGTWNVSGTWVGIGGGVYFEHKWELSDVTSEGTFTGTATGTGSLPTGRLVGEITGGNSVYICMPDSANGTCPTVGGLYPNFTSFFGTVNGKTISGQWTIGAGTGNSKSGLFSGAQPASKASISGKVEYVRPAATGVRGVDIKLIGTTTGGQAVNLSVKTNPFGEYQFSVDKGTYSLQTVGDGEYFSADGSSQKEVGGRLSFTGGNCPGTVQTIDGGEQCDLPPITSDTDKIESKVIYTRCATDARLVNGKPPTNCPIIFVPGFLGSRIVCNGGAEETWPGIVPEWRTMLLEADGMTNVSTNGACNKTATSLPSEGGLVTTVSGIVDVYASLLNFLKLKYPGIWDVAPYDWRKSPAVAVPLLDFAVNDILKVTKSKQVVLFGHSMGGLVIRDFLANGNNKNKVLRVLTAGTPYWGAPKSHFSLLGGYSDTPSGNILDWDGLYQQQGLQRLARNLLGLYHLNPSANFGDWLYISRSGFAPAQLQDADGQFNWVKQLGGTPELWQAARNWHATYDGFPEGDFDYKALVGVGSATTKSIAVSGNLEGAPSVLIEFGNGDGTVPELSATQGISEGRAPLKRSVPIHYACNVGHVSLPNVQSVLTAVHSYLLEGGPITGLDSSCPYSGSVFSAHNLHLGGGNTDVTLEPIATNSVFFRGETFAAQAAIQSTLTVQEALDRELIQVYRAGATTFLITKDSAPVKVNFKGKNIALQMQKISSSGNGEIQSFRLNEGTLSFNPTLNEVSANGEKLAETVVAKKLPVTSATIATSGKNLKVKLSARGPNGINGIYYKLNNKQALQYTKVLKIAKKTAKSLSVSAVDSFGNAEKWKKIKLK